MVTASEIPSSLLPLLLKLSGLEQVFSFCFLFRKIGGKGPQRPSVEEGGIEALCKSNLCTDTLPE